MLAENSVGFLGVVNEFIKNNTQFDTLRDTLFGNVVTTDNLIHANMITKLLRLQYKIVTLEDDTVDREGGMTDGKGRNNSTPLMIQKGLNQVLQSLEGQQMKVEGLGNQSYALQAKKERSSVNLVQMQISSAQLGPIVKAKWTKYNRLKSDYEQITPEEDPGRAELLEDNVVAKLSNVHSCIDKVSSSTKSKRERRIKTGSEAGCKDAQIRQLRRDLNILQNGQCEVEVVQAEVETKLKTTLERLSSTYEMTFECAQNQKAEVDIVEAREQVVILRQEVSFLGNANLDTSQEYKEISERFGLLSRQRDDLVAVKDKILEVVDEMDDTMIKQFQEMFDKTNAQLNDVSRTLSEGGETRLLMVDPEDVLDTGIDVDVQPPGKTVQNTRLFSGGEKSLVAICALLPVLRVRTTPLYIFDEVEATLDQTNAERFAKYAAQFHGENQFIVVTHRPGTVA